MWRPDPRAGSGASPGSPGCPDLLQHAQALHSQDSPLYLSFFEDECRLIADRLRLAAAAAPPQGPCEAGAPWAEPAGLVTSTPLPTPSDGRAPTSGTGTCEAAAAPGPARAEPVCLTQLAAGAGPGARPLARARRGAAQPSGGRPGPAARSPVRGRTRLGPTRTRASQGPRLASAGTADSACPKRLPQPAGSRLKGMPPARSRVQHPSGTLQQAQPSVLPKPSLRDTQMKTAVKAEGHKQPPSRLSTAIPTTASRSSLRPLGRAASSKHFCVSKGSTTQELVCNRTQELRESGESKERLVAEGTVLGAGKADQTWEYVETSLSSKSTLGLLSGCEDPVPAEQSAGDKLSQELERVKKELERVKGELADKTAQCEAYHQTICSLQAQLRAAGVCVEDAAVFKGADLGRD